MGEEGFSDSAATLTARVPPRPSQSIHSTWRGRTAPPPPAVRAASCLVILASRAPPAHRPAHRTGAARRSPGLFSPTSHAPRAPPVLRAVSLSQNGASVSPTGAFDPRSVQHQELGGYVGLEVTSEPPHAVVMALDVLDANFVTQGSPGYSNEPILPGDRILEVRLLRSVWCA